ncbi:M23 family metallopeptidase [Corallincola luteus]|uniref:M23 family metallopeptidase n=2 Tax=Corallincola TaxID=1775176 RepID=A0ABY1WU78_9GAMM|nr:M23 family metallopeptidase [Corallincola spongiicola]TCI02386.1 M23 family metallopeptidase [Corallincola luteus]
MRVLRKELSVKFPLLVSIFLLFSAQTLAIELNGEFIQGGMVTGKLPPGSQLSLDGNPVKISAEGIFVIGFGRDDTGEAELQWTLPGGEKQQTSYKIKQREYNIQYVEGVEQKYVSPPEEVLERIRDDNRQVAAARKTDSDRKDFLMPLIWPVDGPISGVYGSQRYFNGEPKRPHFGLDIAAPTGTIIVAPADGVITLWHPDMYYSGGTLLMDHGYGISSTFIHLSGSLVKAGDVVKQGQPIAKVGATGRVTGAHLDWRINWFKVRLDPQLLLPPKSSEQ